MIVTKMRLWRVSAAGRIEELPEIERKVNNNTHVKFDGTCLNAKQDVEKANIFVEELPISQGSAEEEDLVVIELPNPKTSSFVLIPLSGPNEEESKSGASSSNTNIIQPVMNISPGQELKLEDLMAKDLS